MNIDTHITLDRLLVYAFCLVVIAVATGLCIAKLVTGDAWCTFVTWVTGAVVLGHAAGQAAAGYVQNAQSRAIEAAARVKAATQ